MKTNLGKTKNPSMTSRLGFGTASLAALNNRRKVWKLLDTALESGITHYDTARLYGDGLMERTIAPFVRSNRNEITITTKFGLNGRWRGSLAYSIIPPARRIMKCLLRHHKKSEKSNIGIPSKQIVPWPVVTPEIMRGSLETSLRELNTDYVDIFLMHEARKEQISVQLLEALEDSRLAGKINKYGSGGEWDHTTKLESLAWPRQPIIQAPASICLLEYGLIDSTTKPDVIHSVFRGLPYIEQKISRDKDSVIDFPGGEILPDETLPRIFLHWALSRYPNSTVLFGCRSAERIKKNVDYAKMLGDNQLIEAQIEWLRAYMVRIIKTSFPHP